MTLQTIEVDGADLGGERGAAIRDLLDDNDFHLKTASGPYALKLAMRDGRIVFALGVAEFHLSLGPFRQVMKDYTQICAAHAEGVKRLQPAQIEAIDMARRGIHNEGARLLQERMEGKATMNLDTARRLFTLICAMQR